MGLIDKGNKKAQ
ncbi:hypothetical protein VTH82DRAFT_5993 [Thermothelomyces myriococcoides]